MFTDSSKKTRLIKILFFAVMVVGLGAFGYWFYELNMKINANTLALEDEIFSLNDENFTLSNELKAEKERNNSFESQIDDMSSTVGTLDKLAKTDKELLAKYSKVYFLNENYIPKQLSEIPTEDVYNQNRTEQIHSKILPYIEKMLKAAKDDDINLEIISAYRSFTEQASLKNSYTVVYGSGANKFSADQGYSEHQLGTTVDLTTDKLGSGYSSFGSSDAFVWMKDNAYRYGFILSYPEGNSYYQYEPWHWRFVGRSLAKRLHEDGKNFYDLDQNTINLYLVSLFD